MIHYDSEHKQILSSLCCNCIDTYFMPKEPLFLQVGCCSYSPVMTLFEIYKMIKGNDLHFFLERIYHHPQNTIYPYEIIVHAHIHPRFQKEINTTTLSSIEADDERMKFSVCQFFVENQGCGLAPQYKTSVCRSFICSSIEEQLDPPIQKEYISWVKDIRKEVDTFNALHQQILKEKEWDLIHHVQEIIEYLQQLNKV